MIEDDIIQQIRATREAFGRKHDYDPFKMVAALQAMEATGDRPVRPVPPKPAVDDMDSTEMPAAAMGSHKVVVFIHEPTKRFTITARKETARLPALPCRWLSWIIRPRWSPWGW